MNDIELIQMLRKNVGVSKAACDAAYEAADRIDELSAALTQSRAETAAAYERAAVALDAVAGQWSCGHPAMHCDCARDIEQWGFAADEVRALATPDQTAALDKMIAEAVGPLVEVLTFYQGAWNYKINKRYGGLEWSPKEELLDDCGNKAKNAILAASKKGGV